MEQQDILRERLHGLGFDVVRFASLAGTARVGRGLNPWLAAGHHADMEWMARTADKRLEPGKVLPDARSVVLLGVNYWPGNLAGDGPRWARYSLYSDYHDTLKPALVEAGKTIEEIFAVDSSQYRYYVDTGPVLERGWAERGGVGFIGKNAMLISRDYGNWLFLAEILTTLELVPDPALAEHPGDPDLRSRIGLNCGTCRRCIDACPTQAVRAPGVVDARRCISYQTIENRGIIPRALRRAIGTRVYGCDVCLEVCPWNRFAQESRRMLLAARYDLASLSLADLLALTPERFAEVFRKTPIKRTKLGGLLRNACIVAGNTGDRSSLPALTRLASHPLATVRAHAVWAVFRLVPYAEGLARLQGPRSEEQDPAVLEEYAAEAHEAVAGL